MPDPFRHYEGVPIRDLPADPLTLAAPALDVLFGGLGTTGPAVGVSDGATFLSRLLFYSAAVSASKRVAATGQRYALRVNPSSGNLHPTEFHFATHGLRQWPDGLYHYRPSSHMAEQRARGDFAAALPGEPAAFVFLLTSIVWREAWKYRDRAYRYCLHDIGHAWQALALAAQAMGCESVPIGDFCDDDVAQLFGLAEDEWPMLLIKLHGGCIPLGEHETGGTVWLGGQANQLSAEQIRYPLIEGIHAATKRQSNNAAAEEERETSCRTTSHGEMKLPAPTVATRSFGEVVRRRRSALDFVGNASMSLEQLAAILKATELVDSRFVQLYLYVHQVEELPPGVYRHWKETGKLELIKPGDQRVAAAGLSLGQELAGNACVSFSMLADLAAAVRCHGERGYRYVHFEAGAIGQRLYLAAEAVGLGATGIGAFFDDEVHRYLNVLPEQGQVVYHFAIGWPVPDPRLEA